MKYELYIDQFYHFMRVAILENNQLYTFRVFDLKQLDRNGAIYLGKVQRIVPSLNAIFVTFSNNEIGFLKSPKRAFHEGEIIAVEIIKDKNNAKKALLKERSDIKIANQKKSTILEAKHPLLRLCEKLKFSNIDTLHIEGDLFFQVKSLFQSNALDLKIQFCSLPGLFKNNDLDHIFLEFNDEFVALPKGGNLLIEEGQTLTAIDLNMEGERPEKSFEDAIFHFNLNACTTIIEHIIGRNLGGLILIDFIRMKNQEHKNQIIQNMRTLKQKDMVDCDILGFTKAGLFEIVRYSDRQSLKSVLGDLWKKI
ncbi:MAG: ribonuclease E/G [Alphaproteobacteria bacterium]|nr:ribonuclease E/G [Alphaproteobacteria bacterium]